MNLEQVFAGIDGIRVGIIGDFCLDAYWVADMTQSELSRETPHFPLPIIEERMSPGGAGNVACNVAALCPRQVTAFGVLGEDWRGDALRKLLEEAHIDTSGLLTDSHSLTNAFIKPLRRGISNVVYEDPRLDFVNRTRLSPEMEALLIEKLHTAELDVLCVCDQMRNGVLTPAVRECVCELGRQGKLVIVDSRDHIDQYHSVIIKPNEVEAQRAVAEEMPWEELAKRLAMKTGKPVIVTCGSEGCIVCENHQTTHIPPRHVDPPIDFCGAGDTFLSAIACALAAGEELANAARFANVASSITIKKLEITGTASRDELRAATSL